MNLGILNLTDQLQKLNFSNVYLVSCQNKVVAIDFAINALLANAEKDLLKFIALDEISRDDIVENFHNKKALDKVKAHVYENKYKKNFIQSLAFDLKFMYVNYAKSLIVAVFNDANYIHLNDRQRIECISELDEFAKENGQTILLVSFGLNQKECTSFFLKNLPFLGGMAVLSALPSQYALNTIFWKGLDGSISQGENLLDLKDTGFETVDLTAKTTTANDENDCYETLEDFDKTFDQSLFDNVYHFNSNQQLLEAASTKANAAMICFTVTSRNEIDELCKAIYTLRVTRGNLLKIIVFEKEAGIRAKSEQFMLTCGANFIFESQAKPPYINAMLPMVKTLKFNRTITSSFEALLDEYHLLDRESKGFLVLDEFVKKVRYFLTTSRYLKNNDGCLAVLTCNDSFTIQECASQFTPKRNGDYCSISKNRVIVYFPTCRDGEIEVALNHTFNVPKETLFKKIQAYYKGQDILDNINKIELNQVQVLDAQDEKAIVKMLQLTFNKNEAMKNLKSFEEMAKGQEAITPTPCDLTLLLGEHDAV